jgi:hypothetical protein
METIYTHLSKCKNNKIKEGKKKPKKILSGVTKMSKGNLFIVIVVVLGVQCDIYKSSYSIS